MQLYSNPIPASDLFKRAIWVSIDWFAKRYLQWPPSLGLIYISPGFCLLSGRSGMSLSFLLWSASLLWPPLKSLLESLSLLLSELLLDLLIKLLFEPLIILPIRLSSYNMILLCISLVSDSALVL